jgi:hypothetical protein
MATDLKQLPNARALVARHRMLLAETRAALAELRLVANTLPTRPIHDKMRAIQSRLEVDAQVIPVHEPSL